MSLVVLMSGGIDSSVSAALAIEEGIEVLPVFVNYGQRSLERELAASRAVCTKLGIAEPEVVDLSGFGAAVPSGLTRIDMDLHDDAFLPGRNLMLLLAGASIAFSRGASGVVIGLLDDSVAIYPDQRGEFVARAEAAIQAALGQKIALLTPLIAISKGTVIELARERGLSQTYSCHAGTAQPCGQCIACLEIMNSTNVGQKGI